eukprot:TRINITY_DN5968_c0_g1_i1.p1 TRINITY_DN5968_c0_g1~~TRINITY_DN5968_c0_g1_i1.p1  ORF type:complete len:286 (-),score=108.52 TRINITY_DN5968_c0_g1_i1:196-1053(-)
MSGTKKNKEAKNAAQSSFPYRAIVPNFITLCALTIGISSFVYALNNQFESAIYCILIAAILDALDGPVARAIKGTSRFGAELDSFADYVNFGLCPAFLSYLWVLQSHGWAGWVPCVTYAVAIACRLARFNSGADFANSTDTKAFFMGVPAPGAAGLCLTPLAAHFELRIIYANFPKIAALFELLNIDMIQLSDAIRHPYVQAASLLLTASLAVSSLPTFSSKVFDATFLRNLKYKIFQLLFLSLIFILFISVFVQPWALCVFLSTVYIISMPFSFLSFRKKTKQL